MRAVSSLTNRIFLACTVVAALSLGLASMFVDARASREAQAELRRELEETGSLVDRHLETVTDTFSRLARLIADLPKLKAAVETADPPTVQPLAEEYAGQMNADVLLLTAPDGRVLGQVGERVEGLSAVITDAGGTDERMTRLPHARGLLEVISVPLLIEGELPAVLGRLTVGFFLDDALAAQIKGLTASDIVFRVGDQVVASTLLPAHRTTVAHTAATPQPATLVLGGEDYLVLGRPLRTDVPVAGDLAGQAPVALILRSQTQRLGLLATLRTGLLAALGITVVIATLASYWVARTMTRPLHVVTTTMKEMAATGDLTRRVALTDGAWVDEDARLLASTFNSMTASIARFQKEAAQRERLSALGRLSTIIAHEIRNPLMIIRTALHTLQSDAVPPDERREAVADIDEETMRLNRIVSEVLDFARPVRFDLGVADVNDICRASANAAWADIPIPAVRLELDPAIPEVVTDAERLRLALVNLLTNARHAVEAARVATPTSVTADAAVTLQTRLEGAHVTIAIRDRGTGIAPEDMPHIFDPYFTTRRAGTGLGLPITKNIVEGLGGDIAVSSTPGAGTEMRISLPLSSVGSA